MNPISYQELALAWHPESSKENKPFLIFSFVLFILFFIVAIVLSSIEVPKEPRREKVQVPERVANFILDKPKPKPKIIEKPKAKPKPKPKPKIKRQRPEKQIELTEKQEVARKKAEESGLLALSDIFTDLIDTSSIDTMVGNNINKNNDVTKVAKVDTNLLTSSASEGSGGVETGDILSSNGGQVRLDSQQRAIARQLITAKASKNSGITSKKSGNAVRTGNYRPEEDIAYVMDKNKSKLHALYRKARRKNPGIKGKVVLEITISPEGKVLSVKITSSELNDPSLESRIVSRVKQFNFGVQNVKIVTVTYPIEFLPS